MKSAFSLVFALLFVVHLSAEAPELDKLRIIYETAIERTNRPIILSYLAQLERQRDAYARATNLDAANSTQAEIDAIKKELAELDMFKANIERAQITRELKPNEVLFVNLSWRTPSGTSFHFLPAGKGHRSFGGADKTSISWVTRAGGVVEVTGNASKNGERTKWFFRFLNGSEAYYGPARNDINLKLSKEEK